MESKKPISTIVAGLILAFALIVMSSIFSLAGDSTSRPGGGWISYLIIIGGLILFIHLYAKSQNNYVSFGDLFSYGFKTTAMMTLVFLIFIVILAIAFPEMKEKALEAARDEMEGQRRMSDSDIETGMELMEKYFWVFMAGATMLGFLIVGCIGSLIGAAITKKNPKNPMHQLDQLDS